MYAHFGLVGSVFLFTTCFLCFILWMAGVAGLNERSHERGIPISFWKLVLFIGIPPVPIIWIIKDMLYQRKVMKSDTL